MRDPDDIENDPHITEMYRNKKIFPHGSIVTNVEPMMFCDSSRVAVKMPEPDSDLNQYMTKIMPDSDGYFVGAIIEIKKVSLSYVSGLVDLLP